MTDRELMQQALDAMLNNPDDISDEIFESIKALKERLAQPEQAPWVKSYAGGKPNYTEPQERKPVAWRKNYQNSGYTYFDERWGTIPDDAEPLFSN